MSWDEELHLVPSRNRELIMSLAGRNICRFVRGAAYEPSEMLERESFTGVRADQLFSMALGFAAIELDDARLISVSGAEELMSITVEASDAANLEPPLIEATDATYSEPRFGRLLGRTITGARVLRYVIDDKRQWFPKAESRPREGALVLTLDDGPGILFSFGMLPAPDNFAVFTTDELRLIDCSYEEIVIFG